MDETHLLDYVMMKTCSSAVKKNKTGCYIVCWLKYKWMHNNLCYVERDFWLHKLRFSK